MSPSDYPPPLILQKMEMIDLPAVLAMEVASYPQDEACDAKILDYRVTYASRLGYVCFRLDDNKLVGFVSATGAPEGTTRMTDDMRLNHYKGNVLCIHSVVIAEEYRHKGYGTCMLNMYLNKIRNTTDMKSALLICKRHLVHFYESAGFHQVGLSPIVHGKDPWIEMACTL